MKSIDEMTLQEACDYAVKKIVEQGGQCLTEISRHCAYGDGNGNHCSVGWLLPEDNRLMAIAEGVGGLVEQTEAAGIPSVPSVVTKNIGAMERLQDFHDTPSIGMRAFWRDNLESDFGIDTSGDHWQQWVDMGGEE